jgi:predicted DNA-binding transcriptional regulator AlpA
MAAQKTDRSHTPSNASAYANSARQVAPVQNFDELPDSALVRQAQLVRNPKRPTLPVLLPFGSATLWRKVAEGTFPTPLKLGPRVTAWQVGQVRAWLEGIAKSADVEVSQ